MLRWLMMAALAGLTSGCLGVDRDQARETIGVSLARPADAGNAPPDEKQQALLDMKARQVCTNGYDRLKEDIEPAEDNLQIVDWQVRCRPYSLMWIF
jgi:hypothetical protein